MLSIADIPFKAFHFKGVICVLIIDDKEYKFTTYNNAKLVKSKIEQNIEITLKKGRYVLNITSKYNEGFKLLAPVKGKMEKDILENISASITVTLEKDNKVVFLDTSKNCGLEIVRE